MSQLLTSGGQSIRALASVSVLPNEYSGLISFRIDWFDLLEVQGNLKNLLQHHSSKAENFWHSTFIMVRLLHLYTITGKNTVLTIQTFVVKVMSLLFKMLSKFVTAFFPGSKCLNFKASVTIHSHLGDQENKIHCCFHFFPHLFAMK